MKTILYMGAGASAEAIPTIAQTQQNIELTIQYLMRILNVEFPELEYSTFEEGHKEKHKVLLSNLIKNLEWLNGVMIDEKNSSIDSIASKLFKSDENNFIKLKITYTIFLAVQHYLKKPDPRYLRFFSAIQGSKIDDFRVISWNYDLQWEMTYARNKSHLKTKDHSNYRLRESDDEYKKILHELNIFNKNNIFDKSKFGIFKLNGTIIRNYSRNSNKVIQYPLIRSFYDKI